MLKRLGDIVKGKAADQKEPPKEILMSTDPRSNRSPTSSVTPPIPTNILSAQPPQPTVLQSTATPTASGSDGLQSTLLALLTQAAVQPNGDNSQIGANNNTAQSAALLNSAGLDVNQLALLQQLARTAKTGAGGQNHFDQTAPPLPPFVGNNTFPPGPVPSTSSLPPIDLRARGSDGSSNIPRYESEGKYPGGGRRYGNDYDRRDRDYGRDGGRGRGRGRGRGGYHGGWDDRSSYRDRDKEDRGSLSPRRHGRRGRSRSRSPPTRGPRDGGFQRRDYRARSPAVADPHGPSTPTRPVAMQPVEPGKDEFGRDIRPASVDPESTPSQPEPPIPPITHTTQTPPLTQGSAFDQLTITSAATNSAHPETVMPIATYGSRAKDTGLAEGLDSFDFTTFDFTSPTSWEALGKAWEVTNGVTPTQEMLMQFVMMTSMNMGIGMGTGSFGAGQQTNQWEEAQSSGSWNAEGSEWNDGGTGGVGVGETQDQGEVDGESAGPEKEDSPIPGERSVGSTGKMQKVGDRWVFVRS